MARARNNEVLQDYVGETQGTSTQTNTFTPLPCSEYPVDAGWCQKYRANPQIEIQNLSNTFSISTAQAADLFTRCCDEVSNEFPCEDVSQGWCQKYRQAAPSGFNSAAMQSTINGFISYASTFGYTLTYNEAYNTLLRCCEGVLPPCNPEIQVVCQQIEDAITNNDYQSFLQGIQMMAANWTSLTWAQAVQSAANMNTFKMEIGLICAGCPVVVDTSSPFWDDAIGTPIIPLEQCKCCQKNIGGGTSPYLVTGASGNPAFVAAGQCKNFEIGTSYTPSGVPNPTTVFFPNGLSDCRPTTAVLPCETGVSPNPIVKPLNKGEQKEYRNMSGNKTNHWIPLLVLGLSLSIGIYISEYATKKLIK